MRLTAIVIDDEPHARKIVKNYIARSEFDIAVVGEADNVDDGGLLVKEKDPDFLFLDINIHNKTGFDLLNALQEPAGFELIFTTAYDQYGIAAIKKNAFDYLLKPLNPDDFQNTLNALVQKRIFFKWKNISPEMFKNNIKLVGKKGKYLVSFSSVIRCVADGNYTKIVTAKEEFLYSKVLKHILSEIFPHELMLRCHQSHAFNALYFSHYSHNGNVILTNGDEVPVSRSYKEGLHETLRNR